MSFLVLYAYLSSFKSKSNFCRNLAVNQHQSRVIIDYNLLINSIINQSELEISETENKKLRMELEQMKTQYDSDIDVLKKRNNSLLEDCERYREVC